jgi:hypothetical protein
MPSHRNTALKDVATARPATAATPVSSISPCRTKERQTSEKREFRTFTGKAKKAAAIMVGAIWLCSVVRCYGQAQKSATAVANQVAQREKVAKFIRAKFLVPDSVKVTVGSCHASVNPDYYDCSAASDDGKQTKSQNICISRDGRYLGMSNMYAVGSDTRSEIVRVARQALKLPPTLPLSVGAFRNSSVPNFFETTATAGDGNQKQTGNFFVTKDNRYVVLGDVFPLMDASEIVRSISTKNHPSQGPANAPVTIVEYADLQCPTCARLHEFLENELIPKYAGRVRLVFKDFPLITIHDWTQAASIAGQCAYEIDPAQFVAYRSLIFQNQLVINVTNARHAAELGLPGGD